MNNLSRATLDRGAGVFSVDYRRAPILHSAIARAHRTDDEDSYSYHPFVSRQYHSTSVDGAVRLWDTRASTCQAVKYGHTRGVLDFAVSPDFRTVVTASDDHTSRVFRMVA